MWALNYEKCQHSGNNYYSLARVMQIQSSPVPLRTDFARRVLLKQD